MLIQLTYNNFVLQTLTTMLIQKNPQLKEDAKWMRTIIETKAFFKSEVIEPRSYALNEKETIVTIKTDKGEYNHPESLNDEMAKRFANLEKYSGIYEPGTSHLNARSKHLQQLYIEYKSKPLHEVKENLKSFKKQVDNSGRFGTFAYDHIYVIQDLLKIK